MLDHIKPTAAEREKIDTLLTQVNKKVDRFQSWYICLSIFLCFIFLGASYVFLLNRIPIPTDNHSKERMVEGVLTMGFFFLLPFAILLDRIAELFIKRIQWQTGRRVVEQEARGLKDPFREARRWLTAAREYNPAYNLPDDIELNRMFPQEQTLLFPVAANESILVRAPVPHSEQCELLHTP